MKQWQGVTLFFLILTTSIAIFGDVISNPFCSSASSTYDSTSVAANATAPEVNTSYSYVAGNPASNWVSLAMNFPPAAVQPSTNLQVTVRIFGNINWNGCYNDDPTNEIKYYQISLRYSLDGGNTFIDWLSPDILGWNGGTDFNLSNSFQVPAGSNLLFYPRIRFQQMPSVALNCITDYAVSGTMEIITSTLP